MTAFIFDLDDTLYDLEEPFITAYERSFGRLYNLSAQDLYLSFRKHGDEVFDASARGSITMKDMYLYRIQKAFADYGILLNDERALAFQAQYADRQNHITMTETMKILLDSLRNKQFVLGVLSNGPSVHQWDKVHALNLERWIPKEHIVVSGDVGYTKPDLRIFRYTERYMKLNPSDIWYTGDSVRNDIAGASAAGWHTILFNRRHHMIPENLHPDKIAENENSLAAVLQTISV